MHIPSTFTLGNAYKSSSIADCLLNEIVTRFQNIILDPYQTGQQFHCVGILMSLVRSLLLTCSHVLSNIFLFTDYLCPADANTYGIEFTRFKLRDLEDGSTLFEVAKPPASGRPTL